MSDDDYMMLVFLILALVAWVARLHWTVRKMKRNLGNPAAVATAPRKAIAEPIAPADPDEMASLRQRIAVLERITVEKENSLAQEIESLRRN